MWIFQGANPPDQNDHFTLPETKKRRLCKMGETPGSLEIPSLETTIFRGELLVVGSVLFYCYRHAGP